MTWATKWVLAAAAITALLAVGGPLGGRAAEDDQVRLEVEITAEQSGEPIENAIVYVKFKQERFLFKDKKCEWSVKTNAEGKAAFPPLPEGQMLVQVVAKGWKTYGRYYTLEGPKQVLEIKLQEPKKWY